MQAFPSPEMHTVKGGTDPVQLAVHEAGEGRAVVFSHGFPELAFSWRYQLPAVAQAGFRAIAPDQRGYGGSSKPDAIDAYSLKNLAGDLAGLLDALEIEKAVFVGHDWGGAVAWAMPLLYPDRTLGVAGICTPYMAFPSTEMLHALTGGDEELHYMLWFQKPGVAEAVIDPRAAELMEKLLRHATDPAERLAEIAEQEGPPSMNPFLPGALDGRALAEPLVSAEELAFYADTFARTGFRGGINWYRNLDRNLTEVPGLGQEKLDLPCLMLTAEWDLALRPEFTAGMPALIDDLEMHGIPEAGHWVQQEAPGLVNERLLDWLTRRFGSGAA